MPDDLERALRTLLDSPDAKVDDLRRLSGGASRETWSFDLVEGEDRRPLILQRARPGTPAASSTSLGAVREAELLRLAAGRGVPVPEVLASDDGSVLGGAGMVVERLPGETIARKLLRDDEWASARRLLGEQAAAAMAAIHSIPAADAPWLDSTDQVEQCRGIIDGFDAPHPAFELALRWLEAHQPAPGPDAVVHGDFRLGNLLIDHDGLRAVLDWELCHRGDPLEDLGWFCVRAWRFGSPLPAGGVTTREALVAAYEAASGREVDVEALRWWEVLGTLKWGAICIVQSWGHLSGAVRSMELATIGRRVCENEWDVLGLLPGGPLDAEPAPGSPASTAVHDRPTAVELVEAVREWIEGDVRAGTEGRLAFHTRVAANALRMLERELTLEPALSAAHDDRLATLGCADDRALARRIREGDLDDRTEEVRQVVAAAVRDKLLVANPGWLEPE